MESVWIWGSCLVVYFVSAACMGCIFYLICANSSDLNFRVDLASRKDAKLTKPTEMFVTCGSNDILLPTLPTCLGLAVNEPLRSSDAGES